MDVAVSDQPANARASVRRTRRVAHLVAARRRRADRAASSRHAAKYRRARRSARARSKRPARVRCAAARRSARSSHSSASRAAAVAAFSRSRRAARRSAQSKNALARSRLATRCNPLRTLTRTPCPSRCASHHPRNSRMRLFRPAMRRWRVTTLSSSRRAREWVIHRWKFRRWSARRIRFAMFIAYIVFRLMVSWRCFHAANTCRRSRRRPSLLRANFDISRMPRSNASSCDASASEDAGVPPPGPGVSIQPGVLAALKAPAPGLKPTPRPRRARTGAGAVSGAAKADSSSDSAARHDFRLSNVVGDTVGVTIRLPPRDPARECGAVGGREFAREEPSDVGGSGSASRGASGNSVGVRHAPAIVMPPLARLRCHGVGSRVAAAMLYILTWKRTLGNRRGEMAHVVNRSLARNRARWSGSRTSGASNCSLTPRLGE